MNEQRLLDANVNRSAEGLRVVEDIFRFRFERQDISGGLRMIRHEVRDLFRGSESVMLAARDAENDVGIAVSFEQKGDRRDSLKDCVISNFKRVQEAFRTLEEILKVTGDYRAGKKVEALRYRVYTLEPQCLMLFRRPLPPGIYGILGEKFSRGRTNIEVARQMVDGGIDVLQYREKLKDKSIRQIYEECAEIRKITEDAGVPFIINDHADVALMVGADGIHQGQDDLPVRELRRVAPEMMLGCSTHSPEQARKAIADGADYIGVGPIFSTQTKDDVCDAVGLEYLDHVVASHDVSFVAIGGIKRHNIDEVVSRGAKTVCLVTEIIGAEDIKGRITEIKNLVGVTE